MFRKLLLPLAATAALGMAACRESVSFRYADTSISYLNSIESPSVDLSVSVVAVPRSVSVTGNAHRCNFAAYVHEDGDDLVATAYADCQNANVAAALIQANMDMPVIMRGIYRREGGGSGLLELHDIQVMGHDTLDMR
ncbi:MAG: hypothetical protein HYW25_03695 [Candidatus Aenigmarchaeota archaeon]|nr:hypothetical protein [Candidatus Aenigmarchaeota archaeon]